MLKHNKLTHLDSLVNDKEYGLTKLEYFALHIYTNAQVISYHEAVQQARELISTLNDDHRRQHGGDQGE